METARVILPQDFKSNDQKGDEFLKTETKICVADINHCKFIKTSILECKTVNHTLLIEWKYK